VQPQHYEIGALIDTSAGGNLVDEMRATIAPYAAALSESMNRVIGQVALPLTKGRPESTLGNWTADLLEQAATDLFPDKVIAFAVQNYGGLRVVEIGTGPLTVSELYELMPFDNELVVVKVTGSELRQFVEHTLADGGWPVSQGLSVVESTKGLFDISIRGEPLATEQTYYLAVPDYVARGGDNSAMLVEKQQYPSGRMIRDLLIEYAEKSTTPISATSDGSRIKFAQ
jgi:2',3'-cyclic-nucleotide 2'-phosphodiesterase (5'-nucleotidase family)